MNNEPVVWISEYTLKNCLQGNLTDEVRATTKETTNCTIPLYTHPAELTDEEIISTMVQFDVYSSDDHCLIEAGRAILRKAQEK
jgi:hypothetical protein